MCELRLPGSLKGAGAQESQPQVQGIGIVSSTLSRTGRGDEDQGGGQWPVMSFTALVHEVSVKPQEDRAPRASRLPRVYRFLESGRPRGDRASSLQVSRTLCVSPTLCPAAPAQVSSAVSQEDASAPGLEAAHQVCWFHAESWALERGEPEKGAASGLSLGGPDLATESILGHVSQQPSSLPALQNISGFPVIFIRIIAGKWGPS